MIRLLLLSIAAAAPATAQVASSFDAGKALPLAPGQWSYVATPTGGEARFGALLSLRCDRATRTMTISRPGSPAATQTIVTDTQSRALPPNGRISAFDPLLDAVAFSRGRILVSGGSAGVLAVPSWPEAGRAIEDCRN